MKKIFAFCAALVLAVTAWAGNDPTGDNLITRDYDYRNFTGLSISHSFSVDLRQGNRFSVRVQVPGYLEPYLRVRVTNDVLILGLDNLPRKIQQMLNKDENALTAEVTMPQLYSLNMSGASHLRCKDTFKLDHAAFRMQLSGASRVEALTVNGKGKASMSGSGASTAVMTAEFVAWDIDLSGSSGLRLIGNAEQLDADLSGASWAVFEGNFSKGSVETSGSAKARLNGRVTELEVDGSGASSVEAADTQVCDVDLSGAADCKVSVHKKLKVDLSGASKCRYHAPKDLQLDIESVSRGATLKRL